jgi:plastocyanin
MERIQMKKAATIFAIAALAAFGLAACGSSDNSSDTTAADTTATTTGGGGGGETLAITADPSGKFAFEQKTLTAKAGPVTIDFDNPATLSHDVVLEDQSGQEVGKTDLIAQSKASFTATVKPGTYTYFCSVPGHRQGGMEGTLTVK